ncbi:uncharacterized protein LOC109846162 [Asparagus officinalis]|uniref:uncharacterized protein LOC109846162 n=1 Tax=Asparagus officinalis TaxID=4686 RepID=UPI00098DF47A|nr:uncharacterized protein LOC109846162 [Asparagus officinalis]
MATKDSKDFIFSQEQGISLIWENFVYSFNKQLKVVQLKQRDMPEVSEEIKTSMVTIAKAKGLLRDLEDPNNKVEFKLFARSNDIDIWEIIDCAYRVPTTEKSKWNNDDKRLFALNKSLLEFLINAFGLSFANILDSFDSAYELWNLTETHQGDLEAIRQELENPASKSKGVSSSCMLPLGDDPSEGKKLVLLPTTQPNPGGNMQRNSLLLGLMPVSVLEKSPTSMQQS